MTAQPDTDIDPTPANPLNRAWACSQQFPESRLVLAILIGLPSGLAI